MSFITEEVNTAAHLGCGSGACDWRAQENNHSLGNGQQHHHRYDSSYDYCHIEARNLLCNPDQKHLWCLSRHTLSAVPINLIKKSTMQCTLIVIVLTSLQPAPVTINGRQVGPDILTPST
jgi:hypothetical protein